MEWTMVKLDTLSKDRQPQGLIIFRIRIQIRQYIEMGIDTFPIHRRSHSPLCKPSSASRTLNNKHSNHQPQNIRRTFSHLLSKPHYQNN